MGLNPMASTGPLYPGTVTTASDGTGAGTESANDWLTASAVGAADSSEAQITAATYDTPDISFRLQARNFGFAIPSGATVDGIVVEINRREIAGTASDFRVQLTDSTATLVGSNKANTTAGSWPSTATTATYGTSTDTWAASLDDVDINSANFGVTLSVRADSANTDIGVDFIRVTVYHTGGATTISGSFTADAYIGKTTSGSFTADAEIVAASPVWVSPADTATITASPVFVFTVPSGITSDAHCHMEIDTAATFDTGNLRTLKTSVATTGWEYWNGSAWTAMPSTGVPVAAAGNDARYTVQTPLATGVWYRRVRVGL
jgi:hypothetical protein